MNNRRFLPALLALAIVGGVAAPVWADSAQDAQVQQAIQAAIVKTDIHHPADITVQVREGEVRLGGWADDEAQRFRAVQAARHVDGVTNVEFNRVRLWSSRSLP
ncbi:BON domain-containing protein [Sphaerotilus hippei]|uniref:BON domain-containing protein n=1 Tax=Sphaerotilus hippei TaxID=744406 RepID=A0A318HHB1_9BURK|nr:BON domain-containing protein [Sphaerotilus hippei]PXW99453.1 BON domain-containing protein [Sphaerotilus hippei]